MTMILGNTKPDKKALVQMRKQSHVDSEWYAYQNHDLSSQQLGHTRYLAVGPNNTFKSPPSKMPDMDGVIGWRYVIVGKVNLLTGEVEPIKEVTK